MVLSHDSTIQFKQKIMNCSTNRKGIRLLRFWEQEPNMNTIVLILIKPLVRTYTTVIRPTILYDYECSTLKGQKNL